MLVLTLNLLNSKRKSFNWLPIYIQLASDFMVPSSALFCLFPSASLLVAHLGLNPVNSTLVEGQPHPSSKLLHQGLG